MSFPALVLTTIIGLAFLTLWVVNRLSTRIMEQLDRAFSGEIQPAASEQFIDAENKK